MTAFIGLEGNAATRSAGSLANSVILGSEGNNCPVQLVTNDAARMTVLADGKVGIGTNAPGRSLDVAGTITSTGSDAAFTTSNWARTLEIQHAAALMWAKGAGDYAWGIGKSSAASKLYFFRSATDDNLSAPLYDLVIDNAGDVGIGTTTPAARLQVAGGAIMPAAGNAATAGIQWPSDPGGGSGDFAFLRYYAEAGENTKFLIGLDNDTDDNISFYQAGAQRMTILNGLVGIGMATPGTLLDVNSTIRSRDVFGAGGQNILVGDDTFLSDIDVASTLGVYSVSAAYAKIKLGSSGTTVEGENGGVSFGSNRIDCNPVGTVSSIRLNANGWNIHFNWTGATFQMSAGVSVIKTFIVDHPADPDRYLVHACLEGPENAVFYRGTARLRDGRAEIALPGYFEALTREEGRTVLLTPVFGSPDEPVSRLAHSRVEGGKFRVRAIDGRNPSQKFSWEAKAVRKDVAPLFVEPRKDEIEVYGDGPYKYYGVKRRELSLYPE